MPAVRPKHRVVDIDDRRAPTDLPGVFRHSRTNDLRDENGVLISFINLKKKDDKRFEETLGAPAETPLDLMLGVMKDPRVPLLVRLDTAVKAAPYMHKRMPLAIESDPNGSGAVLNFDVAALAKMKKEDKVKLLQTLKDLGVRM